jgi:hypothetical protein
LIRVAGGLFTPSATTWIERGNSLSFRHVATVYGLRVASDTIEPGSFRISHREFAAPSPVMADHFTPNGRARCVGLGDLA